MVLKNCCTSQYITLDTLIISQNYNISNNLNNADNYIILYNTILKLINLINNIAIDLRILVPT